MNTTLLTRNIINKLSGKSITIEELDYFPTNGKIKLPDTNFYHKGGLMRESSLNKQNFTNNGHSGGVIVLSNNSKVNLSNYSKGNTNRSIGKFFKGIFVTKNGDEYNEKSTSVEINGIRTATLIYVAQEIAIEFQQETVLVKDLNNNKLYLINHDKIGNYTADIVNVKS